MTPLRRLLDSSESSDLERWLLDNAARERPSPSMLSQLRTHLSLDAAVTVAKPSLLTSFKTTILAVSLGTLMGVHTTESGAERRLGATSIPTAAMSTEGPQEQVTTRPDPNRQSTLRAEDPVAIGNYDVNKSALLAPKISRAVRTRERESASDLARNVNGPDLREEIRLLDLARNAVRGQKPEEALASLDLYSQRFPVGAFRQEASMLRMQALAKRGDVSQASSMAKQFVQNHPKSPYVRRASSIAQGSVAPETR